MKPVPAYLSAFEISVCGGFKVHSTIQLYSSFSLSVCGWLYGIVNDCTSLHWKWQKTSLGESV